MIKANRQVLAVGAGVISVVMMLAVVACEELTEVDGGGVRELSWLDFGGDYPLQVEVPESVERGASFQVTFMTYGGGCVGRDNFEVEMSVGVLEAEIVPYQVRPQQAGLSCGGVDWSQEREVTLQFEQAGQAEILLRGRRLAEGDTIELALPYEVEVVEGS